MNYISGFFPCYLPERQVAAREAIIDGKRVYFGLPDKEIRQRTPRGDYDISFKFNEYGFRDDKDIKDSTDGDWFALVDYFTMGWGVEQGDRYTDILQGLTGRRLFNIVVPNDFVGYDALLEYAKNYGATIKNLIIGVCMENDLRDYRFNVDPRARPAGAVRMTQDWLKRHSALYVFLPMTLSRPPRIILPKLPGDMTMH